MCVYMYMYVYISLSLSIYIYICIYSSAFLTRSQQLSCGSLACKKFESTSSEKAKQPVWPPVVLYDVIEYNILYNMLYLSYAIIYYNMTLMQV